MGSLFFEGLLLQASLIFALGAQNLFVLEAGLNRQHHLVVSLVCFLCDLFLIMIGVAGAATAFSNYPLIKIFVGIIGVSFLFLYGLKKLISLPQKEELQKNAPSHIGIKRSVILAITFSILNPHAYLDAFILIGGYSSKYVVLQERLVLGLGAAIFSGLWFVGLSSFSSILRPILLSPVMMRRSMSIAGMILIVLSWKLGVDVANWIAFELKPQFALNDFITYPRAPGVLYTSILY